MLSIGLWWWYINITITVLDIIQNGFSLRLLVKPNHLSPETETSSLFDPTDFVAHGNRDNQVSQTLRFKYKIGRWIMSRIVIVIINREAPRKYELYVCQCTYQILRIISAKPITVAARSKAQHFFTRSNTEVFESIPNLDMDVYPHFFSFSLPV
jgi:hypothetical protein